MIEMYKAMIIRETINWVKSKKDVETEIGIRQVFDIRIRIRIAFKIKIEYEYEYDYLVFEDIRIRNIYSIIYSNIIFE